MDIIIEAIFFILTFSLEFFFCIYYRRYHQVYAIIFEGK